jgi:acyl dehydratase
VTLDPASVGASLPPVESSWTRDDLLLYAVAVGAGPDDLELTTENTAGVVQKALPTYAVIPGRSNEREAVELAGEVDWTRAVDGGHSLELRRPLPLEGCVASTRRVVAVWDKGSAGIVVVESTSVDAATGEELFVNRTSMFFPGQGGFGGERGPSGGQHRPPDRDPDHVISYATLPQQALLYRLTGDRYPIHSDPVYARAAGFDQPILHGLCTFGFAGRALIAAAGGDPARLRAIEGRFAGPGYPGETLTVAMWEQNGEMLFEVRHDDGSAVIDDGRAVLV